MRKKSHWRHKKDAQIEEDKKQSTKVEDYKPLNDPSYWRYEKNILIEGKKKQAKSSKKKTKTKKKKTKKKSSKKKKSPKKLTKTEAWELLKAEQVELLGKLGATKIPRYEKGRVELILKLQNKNGK